jgi:hypothetical protein
MGKKIKMATCKNLAWYRTRKRTVRDYLSLSLGDESKTKKKEKIEVIKEMK